MAMINRAGLNGRGDFIGFTFNGRHSSEFNIIQVSNGNRMGKEILPSPKDVTAQVTGVDGSYYYNSTYGNRTFSINFAFDDLRENDFRAMQYWLNTKEPAQLIFDEEPYKSWTVKINNAPNIKFICFDEILGGMNTRIYKGEGIVNFISYSIIAKAPFPFLEAYNWDYINNKYYKTDRNNTKDQSELQLQAIKTLDSRILGNNPTIEVPTGWNNFDEWKGTSRLKAQKDLDLKASGWESISNGQKLSADQTGTANGLKIYKASYGKNFSWTGTPPFNQDDILVSDYLYRRYGYLSETIFGGLSDYSKDSYKILLDAPNANRYKTEKKQGGTTDTGWAYANQNIKDVDYRRKLTRNPNNPNAYVQTSIAYSDISTSRGGLGGSVTVTDNWAGKIGPVRGITGKWCHVYNPGNYKTSPKIIISVLDKRSMITRSRCNYNLASIVKNDNGTYTLINKGLGNYSDWRYATITLYPYYDEVDFSTAKLTEDDVIGRISLDLTKLTPKSSERDNATTSGTTITIDGKPTNYNYVIDCELRLLYRISTFDTNPDQGWGPARSSSGIPNPYKYYNTTFVPTNDIRNNAIIAGDFFEIPPYELEEWKGRKVKPGRYLIAFNSAAAACVGPFIWTSKHFEANTPETDYSWAAQRVVWDINYL